jgi:hypothetical protein
MSLDHEAAAREPILAGPKRRSFEARGWALARGFFDEPQTARIAAWIDEVLARPETPGEQMAYYEDSVQEPGRRIIQRIEYFCGFHAGLSDLVNGRLKAAAGELLGEPAVLFKEKINFKMPGGGGFEPHQDQQAGWSVYAPLFVTALVTIDAATEANGCLEMTRDPRRAALAGDEWRPLSPQEVSEALYAPVPTDPGDVLFFDSYAPHRSKPNLTAAPRRILYLTYNRAADGDHRARYFADKRADFPPDIERGPGETYRFRV